MDYQSRRPKNLRRAAWSQEVVAAVKELRQENIRMGKNKIAEALTSRGLKVSPLTVQRILLDLLTHD